jgi:repressor LexA
MGWRMLVHERILIIVARPNNDQQHLETLRDYFAAHRVLPSYSELGDVLGFSGKAGAFKLAQRLLESGHLQSAAGGRLAPADRFFERPVLDDKIGAGAIDVDSWSGGMEAHELDRLLVEHPSRTVLVRIRGDSMVDAGVLDGDTAVVERADNARPGDFVAAIVDGKCTVKELRLERRKPVLVPYNKNYQTIRPRQDLQILGVVKGIIRRYRRNDATGIARGSQP